MLPERVPRSTSGSLARAYRNRSLLLVGLLAFAALLVSCGTAGQSPLASDSDRLSLHNEDLERSQALLAAQANPPFYVIEGGAGATLNVLGTIHLGPEVGWRFPPHIETAIAQASAIVLEIDLRNITEESTSQSIVRHGILPADTPLSTIISPKTARALAAREELLAASGASAFAREAMQPWLIMFLVVETLTQEQGFTSDQAVEERLVTDLGDRELLGLETVDEQLALFGGLSIPVQELMLQDTLNGWEEAPAKLIDLIEAWRSNDRSALIRHSRDGVDEMPGLEAFYETILDGRTESWIPQLVEMLEDPARKDETVLVAVGALHLVGAKGLPNLLADAQYRVSPPVDHPRRPEGRRLAGKP